MGWLINLLEKTGVIIKEKKVVESVHLNDLSDWLNKIAEELANEHRMENALNSYIHQLKDKRWVLECKIDEWEKKLPSLANPLRKKEIQQFFNETRELLEEITFAEKPSLNYLLLLSQTLEKSNDQLLKKISDSYFAQNFSFILTEEENDLTINPLLKELIELEGLKEEFDREIVQTGYQTLAVLQKKVAGLESYQEELRKLECELEAKKETLEAAKLKLDEKKEELLRLESNAEGMQFMDAKHKLLAERNEINDRLYTFFSRLRLALKELLQNEPSYEFVASYLDDPQAALLKDENLLITVVLKKIKDDLSAGKTNLSLGEVHEVLDVLEGVTPSYLSELKERQLSIKEEMSKFRASKGSSDFLLRLEEAKYKLDHFSKKVRHLEEEIEALNDELSETSNAQLREVELFQNMVGLNLGKTLEIRV